MLRAMLWMIWHVVRKFWLTAKSNPQLLQWIAGDKYGPLVQSFFEPHFQTNQQQIMANNYGIENTKQVLNVIADTVKASVGIDRNLDGKVDTEEIITYASRIIPLAVSSLPTIQGARPEVRRGELTSEEIDQLVEHVQTLDFLPADRDRTEAYVKRVANWLNYNRKFVEESVEFFRAEPA